MANSLFDCIAKIIESECGQELARRILMRIRSELPGERVYIPARSPVQVSEHDTPQIIQTKNNISKSTSYRIANKFRI
jgi:hypothetical protein